MSGKRIVRRSSEDRLKGKTDWNRVDAMTEEEVEGATKSDLDAPLTDEEFWKDAAIVLPEAKEAISLRIDRDVLNWFKAQGRGYQTRMNAVLRTYMNAKRVEHNSSG